MSNNLESIIKAARIEAENVKEDCKYSSKSHFNAADTWMRRNYWIGVPATVLGALAGAAIIKQHQELAGLLSLGATILTGLMTFLKPSDHASTHKKVGDQYLALRNDARLFRDIELLNMTESAAVLEGIQSLTRRRNELNQSSPAIPWSAFKKARKGIEDGEATYKTELVK
jgi:hypothetical protein